MMWMNNPGRNDDYPSAFKRVKVRPTHFFVKLGDIVASTTLFGFWRDVEIALLARSSAAFCRDFSLLRNRSVKHLTIY
jgi:hypothetical protein